MTKKHGKKKISGFQEWAQTSVNLCTGCQNDCKYCYAKDMAENRFKRVPKGQWAKEKIRDSDVRKKHRLYPGRVGFPTSHDITPNNIDQSLEVLMNLLNWGNEVLIVSKPNFNCIKRICKEAFQFKDSILFRFTIGAMNDEILSFWDTNAPLYNERIKSLKHAFNKGFQTSVSMEPLLDSSNAINIVAELESYVTDTFWIGKMNYTAKLRNRAIADGDQAMVEHVTTIECGQTDEKIWAIYRQFQKRPELLRKIKWKGSCKKILGIKLSTMPGMDI